jgi:hypothetical protein
VDRTKQPEQVKEMLVVVLRPEGIGPGALPWEGGPPVAPPPAAPPQPPPAAPEPPKVPPVDGKAHVSYPIGTPGDVWPPYSGGHRGFAGAVIGFSIPAARPSAATGGSGASFVGAARGGYAVGDLGLELFAELGGDLYGPPVLWVGGGARWMFAPALKRGPDGVLAGAPFFLGPEILGGAFLELGTTATGPGRVMYSTSTEAHGMVGAALDLAYALSPSVQLESQLGNLRVVPGGSGTILLAGLTVGASYRF